ncbi:hypothetical protein AX774_g1191 [Zancudomyces culisetae]|uniref:Uncharacterized protein n=1 Tax=Zancudomyces culisetae TaxID=1213189 RepID=A0A1R1PWA5_ZANCU|nr:hypothetical protein AX774_g1191 [Zancudomyces culisetae]|eukprot:OMH85266.1 hypothetical protein AX774_g1191 [Zancudomyces culisetae]
MSAEDLVENTKYLNSSSKTQGAIRKKQQNITGTNKVPRHMHMLAREFIHNSLYNPNYGYFSKQAMIFSLKEPYEFSKIRDTNELLSIVGDLYRHMEKELDSVETIPRQIWHTPTELLKVGSYYTFINTYKAV